MVNTDKTFKKGKRSSTKINKLIFWKKKFLGPVSLMNRLFLDLPCTELIN